MSDDCYLEFILCVLGFWVDDGYAEGWLGGFGRVLGEGFGGFGGVVPAPEPGHLLSELCTAFCRGMRALAEGEMKVVALELEGVSHADVGHGPGAVLWVLLVVASVGSGANV